MFAWVLRWQKVHIYIHIYIHIYYSCSKWRLSSRRLTDGSVSPSAGTYRISTYNPMPWWRHQMETVSALLALCEGNPPVIGGFPSQRDSNAGFDVFFNVCLNKRLNKQTKRWWFETPSFSLWHHRNFHSTRLLFGSTSTVVSWQQFSAVQTVQSGRVVSRAGRVLARDTHPGTSPTVCPWISGLPWVPVL